MKITITPMPNGLNRVDITPTFGENLATVPQNIVDAAVADAMKRAHGRSFSACYSSCPCAQPQIPSVGVAPNREPDGIDVHVDRPLAENYRTTTKWLNDLAKYRALEAAAKACDWECREPMATNAQRMAAPKVAKPKTPKVAKPKTPKAQPMVCLEGGEVLGILAKAFINALAAVE